MTDNKWWLTGAIYQIYPKSFLDTTGSGTGDIKGIISKLDYLQELGVAAIWLTPMYPSPQVDNGYDVADYCDIDPAYGTLDDFKELVQQAHARDIRIVMDMVFNHSSTEHTWFKQGQDPQSPYHDFYFWKGDKQGELPNNWESKFGGPAWAWNEKAQKHYLHLFATEQADLNWENPQVREEIYKAIEFWAKIGVDGLRLDVINLISKTPGLPNDEQGIGKQYYTDGPKIHTYLQELNQRVLKPYGLVTVGEMSSTTLEHCQQYASLAGNELSMVFNFHHLKVDYPNGEKWVEAQPDFVELKRIFNYWQQGMHNKAWNALFWCNHDQPRIVSRFAPNPALRVEGAKMLAMVLHGMQGTPYVYQGEEIGMTNPNFTELSKYRDVEALNMYKIMQEQGLTHEQILRILAQKSRDNSRTPMQWNATANAGFTSQTPWIDVANNYQEINVEKALAEKDSVFYAYKALLKLRKEYPVFVDGDYQDLLPEDANLWLYQRQTADNTLQVFANLSDQTQEVVVDSKTLELIKQALKEASQVEAGQANQAEAGQAKVLLNNYPSVEVQDNKLVLLPYQCFYLHV